MRLDRALYATERALARGDLAALYAAGHAYDLAAERAVRERLPCWPRQQPLGRDLRTGRSPRRLWRQPAQRAHLPESEPARGHLLGGGS
jgi:hypothetical protein